MNAKRIIDRVKLVKGITHRDRLIILQFFVPLFAEEGKASDVRLLASEIKNMEDEYDTRGISGP